MLLLSQNWNRECKILLVVDAAPWSHGNREGKVLSHSAITTAKYSPIHIHFQRGIWGLDDIEEELLGGKEASQARLIEGPSRVQMDFIVSVILLTLCFSFYECELSPAPSRWTHSSLCNPDSAAARCLPGWGWELAVFAGYRNKRYLAWEELSCCQQIQSANGALAVTAATSHFPLLQGLSSFWLTMLSGNPSWCLGPFRSLGVKERDVEVQPPISEKGFNIFQKKWRLGWIDGQLGSKRA